MESAEFRPKFYSSGELDLIPQLQMCTPELRHGVKVASAVFPFRVNNYIVEHLIDWDRVPEDPIFQLSFPQREMLSSDDFDCVSNLIRRSATTKELGDAVRRIRAGLNPHPASQWANVPVVESKQLRGFQRKYRETALFFPKQGQTCFSYCTFCFRWAQFVGDNSIRFGSSDSDELVGFLKAEKELTDVLFTGGDPMVMAPHVLARFLEPLLAPELSHIQNIRIGTKALAHWPQKFIVGPDGDKLARLFEALVQAGKHLTLMAHYDHWRELQPKVARLAIQRLRSIGVSIRSQAPLLAKINDDADVWATMWKTQVGLGIQPYYMFVERDTGPRRYFEVSLAQAHDIYRDAISRVSGLARTARGPSMSMDYGKVEVVGTAMIGGKKAFVLRLLQSRGSGDAYSPILAKYDPAATWITDLKPFPGADEFPWAKHAEPGSETADTTSVEDIHGLRVRLQ